MSQTEWKVRPSELEHQASQVVEAAFIMKGKKEDIQHGDTFYNTLERHSDVTEDKLLYSVMLGTASDILDASKVGDLKTRRDLTRLILGGWVSHYYQARISVKRGGRGEAVAVAQSV